MIKPKYGVKCLHLGFDRYRRYCKLPVTVKPSKTTISFYVKKPSTPKGKDARVSDHHPNIQHYTDDGGQPWLFDNVSIEFIVPRSKEDKARYRARVEQNASGTIQPFDVTTYQYDSTIIDPTDIITIFKAIIVFLNGGGYTDPFAGTPKEAKVLPRHSNIKPYKGPTTTSTPITCSKEHILNDKKLNEIAIYCLEGCISIIENKQYKNNTNMNKKRIKLTESDLHRIIKESVNEVLNELGDSDRIHNYLGTISGYHDAKGNDEQSRRAYNLSNRIQKNRNNGQLYDPHSEESAAEYRRNSHAFVNGYDNGWDKGRNQMTEVTADPSWWRKDDELPDMKDDSYGKPKQQVKVSETQLHQIVKESIQKIMNEGWFGNLFKSQGQLDFERRRKEAQDAYNKQKAEDEKWHEKEGQNTSVDDSDMNAYRIKYGTTAGYTPNWRERAQRENERQKKAYQNGRSHY